MIQPVVNAVKTGVKHFILSPVVLWMNGAIALLFLGFTFYVKFGSREGWRRAENVIRLFSDCFTREQPFYSFLNNFSEILWSFAAGCCLFSLALLKFLHPQGRVNSFLLYSTALIVVLMIDDLFRVSIILDIFIGIPKIVMYLLYGCAFIVFGFYFRRKLIATPYGLLIVGLFLFVFSNIVDLLPLRGQATPIVLEEGSKLLGLLNFTYYYWRSCWSEVTRSLETSAQSSH